MFLPATVADSFLLPRSHARPRRVLIIANAQTGDKLSTLVGYWGHHAVHYPHPCEGMDIVPHLEPDVVLVEVFPGDAAGLKFAARLRTASRRPQTLVAIARGADESQQRLLRWAGFGHIIDESTLFVGLRTLLECPSASSGHRFGRWLGWMRRQAAIAVW